MYLEHDLYCVTITEVQRCLMAQPDKSTYLCSKLRTERIYNIVD